MKKKKGSIEDFIIPIITIVFVFVVLLVEINTNSALNDKVNVQQVLRKYSLKMECDGYLKNDDANNLKSELTDIGLSNIDLNGTTFNKQDFGNTVYLKCTYTQKYESLNISGFTFTKSTDEQRVTKQISTCAKN